MPLLVIALDVVPLISVLFKINSLPVPTFAILAALVILVSLTSTIVFTSFSGASVSSNIVLPFALIVERVSPFATPFTVSFPLPVVPSPVIVSPVTPSTSFIVYVSSALVALNSLSAAVF